jgi:hypothetical protein
MMKKHALAVSVVVCLGFVLLAGLPAFNAEPTAPVTGATRWEHLAYSVSAQGGVSTPEISRRIMQLGNDGWELVDVENIIENGSTKTTVYYFKRSKK